jgi:hypothetical protein
MRIQNGFGLLSCATPLTLRGAGPPGCHLVLALTALLRGGVTRRCLWCILAA